MNRNDKAMEVKDFNEMYEVARAYESICFDTHKAAKLKDPTSSFVRSCGQCLVKYRKLTGKQLQALMDFLDKP